MTEEKNKSKIPKAILPVEYVKDIAKEIEILSLELHAISHLPDDLKKLVPNATELVRNRIRALHDRQCEILNRASKEKCKIVVDKSSVV